MVVLRRLSDALAAGDAIHAVIRGTAINNDGSAKAGYLALAPDGLIEAFSVEQARSFALGVQWHPEWKVHEHPHYLTLFRGFAEACEARARQR